MNATDQYTARLIGGPRDGDNLVLPSFKPGVEVTTSVKVHVTGQTCKTASAVTIHRYVFVAHEGDRSGTYRHVGTVG